MQQSPSGDWVRVQSRSTGAYYWSNLATGQSAWELDSMKIEKVERDQFIQKIPSGGAYMVPQANQWQQVTQAVNSNQKYSEYDLDIGVNHPGDSSNLTEKARGDMIHYLETLTKVDGNLGEILMMMPIALKRNIESEQFRVRANARFKELLFLDKTYLTVDEFAPQAADLVSDKEWASYLEPAEISRGIFSIFGSSQPKITFEREESTSKITGEEVSGDGSTETKHDSNSPSSTTQTRKISPIDAVEPPELVMKKVSFQRILAASTIVTFLETHGGQGFSSNRKQLMASLSQYLKQINMNETATRLKAERVAVKRTQQLTSAPVSSSLKSEEASVFVGFVRSHEEVHIEAHNPGPMPSPTSEDSELNKKPPHSPTSHSGSHISTTSSKRLSNIFALPNSRVRFEIFVRRSNSHGMIRLRYGMVPVTAKPYKDFVPSYGVLEFPHGVSEVYITLDLIRPTYEQLIGESSMSPTSKALPIKVVKEMEIQLRSPSFDDAFLDNDQSRTSRNSFSIGSPSSGSAVVIDSNVVALRCATCKVSLMYSMPDMATLQSSVGSMLERGIKGSSRCRPNTPDYLNKPSLNNNQYLQPYEHSSLLSEVKTDSQVYSLKEQMSRLHLLLEKPILHEIDIKAQDPSSIPSSEDDADAGKRYPKRGSSSRRQLRKSSSMPSSRDRSNSRTRRSSEAVKKDTPQHKYLKAKPKPQSSSIKPRPRTIQSASSRLSSRKIASKGVSDDQDRHELDDAPIVRLNQGGRSSSEYWEHRKESSSRPINRTHSMSMDRPPSTHGQVLKGNKELKAQTDKSITGNISRLWNRVSRSSTEIRSGLQQPMRSSDEELKEEVLSDASDKEQEDDIQALKEEAEKVNQRLSNITRELAKVGVTIETGEEEGEEKSDEESEEGGYIRDHNESFSSIRNSVDLASNKKMLVETTDKLAMLNKRSASQDSRSRTRVSQTSLRESMLNDNANASRDRIARRSPSPVNEHSDKEEKKMSLVNKIEMSALSNRPTSLTKKPSLLARMFRDSRENSVEEDVVERSNREASHEQHSQPLLETVDEIESYDYNKIDSQMEQFLLQVFRPIITCSNQLSTVKCTPHHFFKLCGRNTKQAISKGTYIAGLTIQDLKDLCKKLKVDYLSNSLVELRKAFKMVDQGNFKELDETVGLFASQASSHKSNAFSRTSSTATTSKSKTKAKSSSSVDTRRKSVVSKGGGNLLSYALWAAAWSAHFEDKKVRSPRFQKQLTTVSAGRSRARKNWLKVVRTVSTARYWSTLVNFSWQENDDGEHHDTALATRSSNSSSHNDQPSPMNNHSLSHIKPQTNKKYEGSPQQAAPPSPEMIEARNDKHKLMKRGIKSTKSNEDEEPSKKDSHKSIVAATSKKNKDSPSGSVGDSSKKSSRTIEKMKKSIGIELEEELQSPATSPTGSSLEATMREWRKRAEHREDLFSEASKLLGRDKPSKKTKKTKANSSSTSPISESTSNERRSSSLLSRSNSLKKSTAKKLPGGELVKKQDNRMQPPTAQFEYGSEEETY